MNFEMIKNYLSTLFNDFFHFKFLSVIYLIHRLLRFIYRILKYQIFTTTKCPDCDDPMFVYFMRSEHTVGMGFDQCRLYDWLICQNEYCDYREKIKD